MKQHKKSPRKGRFFTMNKNFIDEFRKTVPGATSRVTFRVSRADFEHLLTVRLFVFLQNP